MAVALNFKSEGTSGPFVVILHGLLGSSGNWRSIARKLGETHRVYCLDLRNHGASPHVDTMTYPDMADDVRGFLDEHGIDAATVVGHSMGGKTAMLLALAAPVLGASRAAELADAAWSAHQIGSIAELLRLARPD